MFKMTPPSEQIKQPTAHKHHVFIVNHSSLMQIASVYIVIHNVLLNLSDLAKCLFGVYTLDIELNFQPSLIII